MRRGSAFHSDEEIIETLNGCICCSVRQDLIAIIKKLAARSAAGELKLDAIVIETTGMADPAPVAQTFLVDAEIKAFARLDGIVTLVDAKHIEQHLDERKPAGVVNEAAAQVAFADRLLLNKTDLVSDAECDRLEARLRAINALAPIVRTTHSSVGVERVLGIHGFDLERALQASPGLLDTATPPTKHDASVTSVSLDQGAPRHMCTVLQGELDIDLLEAWIGGVLRRDGADMFRMKGVLAIAHAKQRFVYHAVHMTFEGSFAEPWAEGEGRESKLVFIGKNLDAKALAASFNACLATPANLEAKAAALRFNLGDRVEVRSGPPGLAALLLTTNTCAWSPGVVVARLYRDETETEAGVSAMPPGVTAPYQVRLDDGRLVWPLEDCDHVVRAPRRWWSSLWWAEAGGRGGGAGADAGAGAAAGAGAGAGNSEGDGDRDPSDGHQSAGGHGHDPSHDHSHGHSDDGPGEHVHWHNHDAHTHSGTLVGGLTPLPLPTPPPTLPSTSTAPSTAVPSSEGDVPSAGGRDGFLVAASSRLLTPLLAPCASLLAYLVTGARMRASRRLYKQKRFDGALAAAESARLLARTQLGEESPRHEAALLHLASTHAALNSDGAALAALAEAELLATRLHGAGSLQLVPLCHAQAEVYEASGQFELAVGALARARALRRETLGPEDIKFAGSCFNQAGLLVRHAGAEAGAARRGALLTQAAELGVEASVAAAAAGNAEQARGFPEALLEQCLEVDCDAGGEGGTGGEGGEGGEGGVGGEGDQGVAVAIELLRARLEDPYSY